MCRPIALSHVHGDHIAALCWGRSHLCHLEEQLPVEGAHSPRVRGEGLVLGVLRMRQGALVTGGGDGGSRREVSAARWVTGGVRGGGLAVRARGRASLVDEECLVRLLLARAVEQQQAHGVARQVDQQQPELHATAARGEAGPRHLAAAAAPTTLRA